MEISLAGKAALVTGGNTGIGRAVSLSLARCGADVALTYFSHQQEGEQTANEIRALGRKALCLYLDAADSAQVDSVVTEVADAVDGHVDILVNNAGHLINRVPISEMTDAFWSKVMAVNLSSAFYCSRAILPYMTTGWGRIVNMSSLAAHNGGGSGAAAYAAAKAGVLGFTRGLAKEVGPRGITVNALTPGLILDTPFHEAFTPKEAQRAAIASIPLQRAGTPDDVAGAVLYFVSELASFITGEVAEINGGMWFA